jgi:hypothetical protein
MRLRLALTAVLATLGLAACELEPTDPIFLSGRALEADGSPWRGGALPLLRQLPWEPPADGGMTDLQDGFRYGPWRTVETDAEGRFLHRLTGRDLGVRDSFSAAESYFQLQLPPSADGSEDLLSFRFSRDAELPPLRRWGSALSQAPAPGGVQLRWVPAVADEDLAPHTYALQVYAGQTRVWQANVTGVDAALLEPELVEDFGASEVRVSAFTSGQRRWMSSSLAYELRHHSPRLPLPLQGRVPESRGAACRANGTLLQPCPLTDGSVEQVELPTREQVSGELVLQLQAPLRPGRLLLRGLDNVGWNVVLQVDGAVAEGAPWQLLARRATDDPVLDPLGRPPSFMTRDLDLRLEGAPAVTQLRLRLLVQNEPHPGEPPAGQPPPPPEFAALFYALGEVSVFSAAP